MELTTMDDSQKLLKLADACSDALIGGERGWEIMEFDDFVSECRKALSERNKFKRMIDEGLGWEDMINDIAP
jgi:hypothetical protein